jgi:aminoglycoside 2''-phosphotransferase
MNELESYAQRIGEIAPEVTIASMRLNLEGLINDVVIVNDQLVFRFAKSEHGLRRLKGEIEILRLLKSHITLAIPSPFYVAEDCMAYPLIPGETLRRDRLMRLSEDEQQAVAEQLAQFFRELHGFPAREVRGIELPTADALMKYEGWVNAYGRIREKVFPLLLPHVRDWVTEHFESHLADRDNFEYELKMVDTDIPPYHIMFDRERSLVNGIIDFGCAGMGDPGIDFGVIIYNYGESFLRRFYKSYPEAEGYLKRARFYAGAHEVRWLLNGVETGDPFWFAVHAGSAKDFGYNYLRESFA